MLPLAPLAATSLGALAGAAPAALATGASAEAAGAAFAQTLEQFGHNVVDALKSGEGAAISGVQGKLSTQKVVETVLAAERELQTAIALRDKAVSAYQEISRMAI